MKEGGTKVGPSSFVVPIVSTIADSVTLRIKAGCWPQSQQDYQRVCHTQAARSGYVFLWLSKRHPLPKSSPGKVFK